MRGMGVGGGWGGGQKEKILKRIVCVKTDGLKG